MDLSKKLKATALDTWKIMQEAQLPLIAQALAYTTILSIVPLLAVSFSVFQAFGGMDKLYSSIEPIILENLAEGSRAEAMQAIRKFIGNIHAGALGGTGLVVLIFTSMSMLNKAENAINSVWRTQTTRSLFQRISTYWLFITLGPVALSFAVGAASSSSQLPVSNIIPSGAGLFLMTSVGFFLIYKYVPNRRVNAWPAAVSAIVTAGLWNLGRVSYAFYTKKAVSYDKIYGSLGAIPVFILWIYIAWTIVLTGAALTFALQKRFDIE